MEKLINLLNEYEGTKETIDYTRRIEKQNETRICGTEHTGAYVDDEEAERIIISKRYGFIKRLVDNEKIDFDKTGYKKADFQEVRNGDWRTVKGYEMILMLLSINNNSIEFLINILR